MNLNTGGKKEDEINDIEGMREMEGPATHYDIDILVFSSYSRSQLDRQ
jgi:hypothetical protein